MSVDTLRLPFHMLGEDLVLGAQERDAGIDRTLNQGALRRTPEERVAAGLQFADFVRENLGVATRRAA